MFFSRGLQIGIYFVVLNAVLVAVSLLHRKIVAVDPPKESLVSATATNPLVADPARVQSGQSRGSLGDPTLVRGANHGNQNQMPPTQDKLEQLAPSILNSTVKPIADDDPLMAEIRKQFTEKLPELSVVPAAENPVVKPIAITSLEEEQLRHTTIGHLSASAETLIRLAQEFQKSGKTEEAEKHIAQAKQIKAQIKQLAQ
jgi:hypothetical protein